MYAQDYDEIMTPWRLAADTTNPDEDHGYVYWYDLIDPYVKNEQIFVCPSSEPFGSNCRGIRGAYGLNIYIDMVKMATIKWPAEIIWTCDTNCYRPPTWSAYSTNSIHAFSHTGYAACHRRHNEGCNTSYADGHAKWIKSCTRRNLDPGAP